MRIKFLGSGDAFGSGGRFNTCFLVDRGTSRFLIDCGASSMIAMRAFDVDPNGIGAIVISHLHGDHFGGLPFFILDAQHVSRRREPLIIAGPQGLEKRLEALMEAMFPGSWSTERKFAIEFIELAPLAATRVGAQGPRVTGYPVSHPSGATSLALRIECGDQIIAYTGDTEWVEALEPACRGADLLIAECYQYDRPVRYHMSLTTLREQLPPLGARRVILTHMSAEMLAHVAEAGGFMVASDGLELTV